jgi:hypothetical protein
LSPAGCLLPMPPNQIYLSSLKYISFAVTTNISVLQVRVHCIYLLTSIFCLVCAIYSVFKIFYSNINYSIEQSLYIYIAASPSPYTLFVFLVFPFKFRFV